MTILSSATTTTPHILPSGHGQQQLQHHAATTSSLSHDDHAMIQTALAVIVVQRRRQQQRQRQLASSSSSLSSQKISLPTTGKRPLSSSSSSHALEPPPHCPNNNITTTRTTRNRNHPLASSSSVTTLKKNAPLPFLPPHDNQATTNTSTTKAWTHDYWKTHLQHLLLVMLHQEEEEQWYQNHNHSLYLHFVCQWEQLLQRVTTSTLLCHQPEQEHPATEEMPHNVTQWLYEQWTRPWPPVVTAATALIPTLQHAEDCRPENHRRRRNDDDDPTPLPPPPPRPKTPPHRWYTIWRTIVSTKPHVFCHTPILSLLLRLILPNDDNDNHRSSSLPTWPRIYYIHLLDPILTASLASSSFISPHQRHRIEQMFFQQQQWSTHLNDHHHHPTTTTGIRRHCSSWYSVSDLAQEYEAYYFPSPMATTIRTDDFGDTVLMIHGLIHWSERMNHHHHQHHDD